MAAVRKPPVPQAGSRIVSPSLGSIIWTMNCVTARGRVELARVARRLQVSEDLLVHVAEQVPVFAVVEIDLVDLVDDLPHQRAVLHVLVGIVESVADDDAARVLGRNG